MSPARVARASLSSIQARGAHTAHTPVLTVIKTLGPLCCFSIALLHPLKSHFGRQAADRSESRGRDWQSERRVWADPHGQSPWQRAQGLGTLFFRWMSGGEAEGEDEGAMSLRVTRK